MRRPTVGAAVPCRPHGIGRGDRGDRGEEFNRVGNVENVEGGASLRGSAYLCVR